MALPEIPLQARQATLSILSQYITEENSDRFIKILHRRVKAKLPRWLRWLPIGIVLDRLFPEILLEFFEDLLA